MERMADLKSLADDAKADGGLFGAAGDMGPLLERFNKGIWAPINTHVI